MLVHGAEVNEGRADGVLEIGIVTHPAVGEQGNQWSDGSVVAQAPEIIGQCLDLYRI